jgi:chromosome partitioning protein
MKTIAFLTQKGGSGKTTLAASVGVAAQEAGERVFLIDMDPQGSLMSWGARRKADEPGVDKTTPDKLESSLAAIAKAGYTLAIVDSAGADSATNAAIMRAADLSIIPARPTVLDIEASRPTVAALTKLSRPFAFVLNQCPSGRTTRPQDASRALGLLGVLAEPLMMLRADHQDAIGLGLGVTEHDPAGKAADETRQLWQWIAKRMRNGNG